MQKHLESAQSRFKLGDVTKTDVAEANAGLAKANSDLISAGRALANSKAAYTNIMGQEPVDVKMPKAPAEIYGSIDDLISIARTNNPSVKYAQYTLDAAEDDISIQKSVLLPQISAFASRQKDDGTSISSIKTDSDTVGVKLSIPIFQGGGEYAQIRKAKHAAGKSSYDLAAAQNDAREAVIKAYQDFQVAQALIRSNQTSVVSFTVALEGTEQESYAGTRTTIDVLDAEHALVDAKTNLIASRRDEIVTSYNLLAQLGRLTAKDLKLKVDLYNPQENADSVKYKMIGY